MRKAEPNALAGPALATDDLTNRFQLHCQHFVGGNDLVESVGDLGFETLAPAREAYREITDTHRLKRLMEATQRRLAVRSQPGGC